MGVAIGIASNNATNIHITNLWHKVGELEDVPSMQSLKYPPHFTFAIYQNIDMVKFREDLNGVFDDFRQIRIVFDQIRFFNASPLILWASPKENSELLELHSAIHAKIDLSKCDELYRPQHWVAHCTLGNRIQEANRTRALSLVSKEMEPFEVLFDTIDFIEFPPIRVAESIVLTR